MAEVFFFIAAAGALFGAIGVVFSTDNPFYSVLSLVAHLLSLAGLFLLLRAEMLAAAQVVVYAGAVMVLYVFVVAYVGGGESAWESIPGRVSGEWTTSRKLKGTDRERPVFHLCPDRAEIVAPRP